MLLLKTHEQHVAGVRKNRKHATDGRPLDLRPGDDLLVQVTYGSLVDPTHRVKYAMKYVRCYEDRGGESKLIWGHQWRYIIEGRDLCILRHPFDIDKVKVSNKNYGQGVIRFAYIDSTDEEEIRRLGLLECA